VPLCPCDRRPTLSHLEFLFGSLLARAAGLGPEAQAPPCVDWRFPAWHKAPTHRLALAVLLVAILVTLVPLVHSSPPDPTWVAGVWDNADYDDVVALAAAGSGVADAYVSPFLVVLAPLGLVQDLATGVWAACPLAFDQPRAPPAA
jgi:hypothetical protein